MTTSAPQKIEKQPVETTAEKLGNLKDPSAPKKSFGAKLAGWAALAGKIIAWQIIAILVVEFTLACAGLGEEEIFKLDPRFGFVHMNNKHITWRSEGYAKSYFGPDGMREAGLTMQKPAGTYRVAVLGDSIVESLQVPFEDTFTQLLQKDLKKSAEGKDLQILNFGNSGYSTAQEYLQLKNKVLNYQPDAVLCFYNHRDIFENWAPPDQTLTNVRPYALHLPGQELKIENNSVLQWMRSPRGKFLMSISWIREHSRIWGMIATWETQASFHDPVYRAITGFLTSPKKSIKAGMEQLKTVTPQMVFDSIAKNFKPGKKAASFKIQFIDEKSQKTQTTADKPGKPQSAAPGQPAPGQSAQGKSEQGQPASVSTSNKPASAPIESAKSNDSKDSTAKGEKTSSMDAATSSCLMKMPDLSEFPGTKKQTAEELKAEEAKKAEAAEAQKGRDNYLNLMFKTLGSLFSEMQKDCAQHGVKFAIAIAPSKLALVEKAEDIGLMDLTYEKEIERVQKYCEEQKIPFVNMQKDLKAMPSKESNKLFYTMHLTSAGQQYVAKEARELVKELTVPASK